MFSKIENWLRRIVAEELSDAEGVIQQAHRAITARELEVLSTIAEQRADVEQFMAKQKASLDEQVDAIGKFVVSQKAEIDQSIHAAVENFFPGLKQLRDSLDSIATSSAYLAAAKQQDLDRSGHPIK